MESRVFSCAQTPVMPPPLVWSPRKFISFRIWPETAKLKSPCAPVLAYWTASLAPGVEAALRAAFNLNELNQPLPFGAECGLVQDFRQQIYVTAPSVRIVRDRDNVTLRVRGLWSTLTRQVFQHRERRHERTVTLR